MNKTPLKMLPRYLLGLLVLALSSWLIASIFHAIPSLRNIHWFFQLLPAILGMVGALIAHKQAKGRKWLYIFGYFLNAFASGCAVGAVLGKAAMMPSAQLFPALLPAAAVGVVVCLLLTIPHRLCRNFSNAAGTVGALVIIGVGIYFWVSRSPLTGCALVFSGLFLLPFPIGCDFMLDAPEGRYRYLSFTGFGAFIVIAVVAAIILSGGEILEGLDLGGGSESKKAKPKVRK